MRSSKIALVTNHVILTNFARAMKFVTQKAFKKEMTSKTPARGDSKETGKMGQVVRSSQDSENEVWRLTALQK